MSETLFALSDINMGYGELSLLENAKMSVDSGDLVLLLGNNGVGKSTLLRGILNGVYYKKGPSSYFEFGKVTLRDLLGNDLSSEFGRISEIVGTSKQDTDDFPSWYLARSYVKSTLEHNYKFLNASTMAEERNRIGELFRYFKKDGKDISKKLIRSLSGGQRQIVNIVSCFSRIEAPLYFLDEPFNNLDTLSISRLTRLVDSIRSTPLSNGLCPAVVVVTHCHLFKNPTKVYRIKDKKLVIDGDYHPATCIDEEDLESDSVACPFLKRN